MNLWDALPSDFYYQPDHARPPLELTVTSVVSRHGGWTIGVEGREGRTAEVYVDELFNLQGAEETTEESPP